MYERLIEVTYFHEYEIRQEDRPSDHWPIKIVLNTK